MVEKNITVRKTTRRSPSSRVSQRRLQARQARQARVESILQAAIAVFAHHGYQGTTMAMVAEQVSGTPFATHLRMTDHATGHVSELIFSKLKTNQGLPERTFSERNLRQWTR